MAFLDDIKSKHLTNYVLVTVSDNIRISTQNINFDGEYYKPILMNIPSISESLDIEQRKYKISSVTLNISDYEHDGVRFSDSLNTLMNKEVNIYYASMGSKEFTFFGDSQGTTKEDADLYKAGTFIVRSFSQNEDTVSLNCEDLSQDKLHQDFPFNYLGDDDVVPDKYKNKPIPMVFGSVDRSPCLISENYNNENFGNAILISDFNNQNIYNNEDIGDSFLQYDPLFLFINDKYYNISKTTKLGSNGTFEIHHQYNILQDGRIELLSFDSNSDNLNASPAQNPFLNIVEVNILNIPNEISPSPIYNNKPNITSVLNEFSDQVNNLRDLNTSTSFEYSSENIYGEPLTNVTGLGSDIVFSYKDDLLKDENITNIKNFLLLSFLFEWISGNHNSVEVEVKAFNNLGTMYSNTLVNMNDPSSLNFNTFTTNTDNFFYEGQYADSLLFKVFPSNQNQPIELNVKLREFSQYSIFEIDKLFSRNFFANVTGRISSTPSAPSVFTEILSELNFNQEVGDIVYTPLGSYSFTIDKKINSKKLIEEISQSTSLYPYFKNGQFKLKSIKKIYSFNETKSINVDDVINYKYDRTKIEKVYTRVNVKYHYDYGIKDFTRETGDVTPTNSGLSSDYLTGSNENYFGEDFDQELVFESKYIRDKATAFNLARYLCGLHANQHNLITLTLPLNYINLELGDIIRLDKLIQGRKIFGEDYALIHENQPSYIRNGQIIYKFFFVEQIKKSLDKVEVKLYQLHEFDFTFDDVGVDEIIDDEIDDEIEDEIDDTEPPVDPPPNVIEACLLPDFENSYLDGNLNPVDVTDNSLIFSHNQDLCGEEIIAEQVGWCTINGNTEFGVTESDCSGTWTVNQPVIACGDPNALNYNSNVDIADNTLCFLQESLLPPQITTPTEDEVIPLQSIEEVNQPELNDSDWVFRDNNQQQNGNQTITGGNQSLIVRCGSSTSTAIDLYSIDSDGNPIPIEPGGYNYTVIARRINNNNYPIAIDVGVRFGDNVHYLNTEFTEFSGNFNASSYEASFNYFTIKQRGGNINNNDNSYEISSIIIRKNGINVIPDPNRNSYFSNNTAGGIVTVETLPVLNLTWNKSPNLLNHSQLPPSYLGGSYIVSLVRSYNDENGDTQLENVYTNENNLISAVEGQDTYTHTIDFVEQDIPVDSRLQVSVIARSFSQYNGQNIFTGDADEVLDYTIAQDTVNFNYGDVDEEEQAYDIVDVVQVVNFILSLAVPNEQDLEQFDFTNDGVINVLDIIALVNIILGD